jgi:hypothetical protein
MNESERRLIQAELRQTAVYREEADFLQNATVEGRAVQLVARHPGAAWVGKIRVRSGAKTRTLTGNASSKLRVIGPVLVAAPTGGTQGAAHGVLGLDPEDLIRADYPAVAVAECLAAGGLKAANGCKLSPANLAVMALRLLKRDCVADLDRVRDEVDRGLRHPGAVLLAERMLAAKVAATERRSRDKRLHRFMRVYLPQGVEDGLERDALLDAFNNLAMQQVVES